MVNSSFSLTWDSLQAFLSGRMYMPHGNCYLWQTPLVGLHLVANALTAIAYFSIPIMLVYFVRKRQNMPFSRVFLLFSAFITACGVGHLLDMVTLWFPIYWIDGFERSFTALVSCYTAVELYTLLPKFLALKSPEELALINQQLQVEIQERKKAESILSRILEGTAAVTGRDFFAAFVENLAIALNVRQVEISEILSSPPDTRQILATWENPQFAAPQGSLPQEAIASQALKFPIRDREARSIGCLQIHYDQTAINQEQTTKLITIFAARAAAEIERKRALDELAHANNQLEAINNQLEEKVAERTIALKTVNQTLKTRIERLRLTEDALRSSEARYRSLVLNIPGAVYRCLPDEQWTMEFLSNGIEAITGYLATDFLNNQIRPFGAIIHPEDHDRTLASLKSITPAQPTFTDEYRLIRRDQSICWVFEQGRGIFDHDDTLVRLEGVMIEVTDRKLASQALEQERRQLRQLIRNMPVAVAMLDEHLCYVAHSHQWLVDYHLQVESLLGRSHLQVFPQFTQKHQANLQQALGGQVISCDEDVYIQGDGTKQYLKWTIQPWYYQENQVGGVVIVTQNINDLVEGREAALAASRLKSRFLANMSHEIRTPMNGILGIAELLQTTQLNSQQQDFIKTLTQSANHLLYLINDILDFSKLEAGEMRLESIALDVVDCVESVAELLAFQAQTKQVEVITNIDPGLRGTLQGDPVRLRQILTNLVGNGIKFTHQGSVTIRVFPVVDHETSVLVRFEVKDTGIGIDQADQEKLFRSFSQVDPSTTRQYGGTGLGLAIAQHLVSLMGGSIGLDSAPGQGSTFWFTACFSRLEAPPPLPQLAPYRVLLIDSHPLSLQATQGYLSHCGVSVIAHGDFMGGILALEQAVSIDLILLALPILGNQTGIEAVLEKVKGLLPRDNLVLLVSAVDYTRLKNWIQNQGIRYLLKPIQQKALLACLQAPVTTNPTSEVELTLTEILDAEAQQSPEISILVVEDTPINQTVVLNQLDLMGFRDVDCVNNGREALDQLRHKTYDLVLMDCLMPELDGYSTTKVIRDQEQGDAHQLIIAMTANAMKGDREKCLAAGMDGYIAKPISLDTLHQVIDQCLQKLPHRRPISPLKQVAPKVLAGAIVPAPGEADLPINLPRLTQLYGDNPRFYREMFKQFMTFAPGYIEALRGAIASKDPQQISYEAHRLKGATSSVSIRKIPEWCTAIEFAIPEQNYVTLERLMGNIHDYFEEVTQFINHYFES
ncbi:response regulator [Picosynechococcus sp. NKBG15041c]|uniref:response regulator n=1 Tax=Picosynechococcus sp. NKBG15041c TaxID=1407650 RepID=UPI0009DB8A9B|nr:response regulator [Picosynechococcus sp. NKBG15041c]